MTNQKPCKVNIEKTKHIILDGGAEAWRVTSRQDHGWNVDAWITHFQPGDAHDWHDHEEDELIYIIEGKGQYELDESTISFQKGDTIFLPKKTRHRSSVLGDEEVALLAIFSPARE